MNQLITFLDTTNLDISLHEYINDDTTTISDIQYSMSYYFNEIPSYFFNNANYHLLYPVDFLYSKDLFTLFNTMSKMGFFSIKECSSSEIFKNLFLSNSNNYNELLNHLRSITNTTTLDTSTTTTTKRIDTSPSSNKRIITIHFLCVHIEILKEDFEVTTTTTTTTSMEQLISLMKKNLFRYYPITSTTTTTKKYLEDYLFQFEKFIKLYYKNYQGNQFLFYKIEEIIQNDNSTTTTITDTYSNNRNSF